MPRRSRVRGLLVPIALAVISILPAGLATFAPSAAASGPDGRWFEDPPGIPSGRFQPVSAYDPVRKRMWMFGGLMLPPDNAVWSRSLVGTQEWTQFQVPAPWPTSASSGNQALVYDSAQDRLLLVGGGSTLWALGNLGGTPTGSSISTTGSPSGAFGGAVYDAPRNRVLALFGSPAACMALDLTAAPPAWSTLVPGGPTGPDAVNGALIEDSVGDRLVLFGGNDAGGLLQDTWTLNLTGTPAWHKESPAGPLPPARSYAGASYDDAHQGMIVVGGGDTNLTFEFGDVWTLDLSGSMAWSPGFHGVSSIPARRWQAQVFDPDSDRVVLFGGVSYSSDAILRDDLAIGPNGLSTKPGIRAPRFEGAASYDPVGRDMILFGGAMRDTCTRSVDALHLDPEPTWRQLSPLGPLPTARMDQAQGLDLAGHRLIVFGGRSGPPWVSNTAFGDTWELDLDDPPTWTPLSPGGAQTPSPRCLTASAFDPVARQLLVFAGSVGGNELWSLSVSGAPTWSLLSTGAGPAARIGASMVYDSHRHRMLVFGGADPASPFTPNCYNDVWAYELDSTGASGWSPLSPAGTPPSPRELTAAVYDSMGDRMVILGGSDGSALSDTWELALGGGAPTWAPLTPGPPAPTVWAKLYDIGPGASKLAYGGATAIHDPVYDRMVATGLGLLAPTETWQLAWAGIPTPTLVSLVDANASAGTAHLTWFTPDGAGVVAAVERTVDGATWETRASIRSDASGQLSYEDAVTQGGRYGYRLTVGPRQQRTEITWLDVPAAGASLRTGLAGAWPNPSRGAPTLSFTLASGDGAAVLDVFDVAGRRVYTREVSTLGPGVHALDLGGAFPARAGVYLATLRVGGSTTSRKFAVLP